LNGWVVIPVNRANKRAVVRGHHGRERRRPTNAEYNYWLRVFAKRNIAIVPPRDVVCPDVDAYGGKRGAETLDELEADLGPLPSALKSTSRWPEDKVSGIYLFRVPREYAETDWPSQAGPGIDIICWFERYVICPPSIHQSGRQYKWIRDGALLRGPMSPDSLEYLPRNWCEYLASRASAGESGDGFSRWDRSARAWLARYGSGAMCAYMAEMAPKRVERLRVGSAYDAMRTATATAVKATAEGHTGINAALWPVRDAYIAEVGSRPRGARRARRRSERVAVEEWRRALDGAVRNYGGLVAGTDSVCDELEAFYS
jgi:hypothetical protein